MRRARAELESPDLIRLAPAAGVMVVWAVLMFLSGGFQPNRWLPAGLVLIGLTVLSATANGRLLPSRGPARAALVALAAFTAWCFASLLWTDAPGDTWEAANLLLVALAGTWALSLAPWTPRAAWLLLMAFSLAAAAACLAGLMSALGATDLTSRFEDLRFSPPLDYPNSTAAFALMAAVPMLLQAARPDASVPAKAFAQGLAMFLAAYALLPQSRGAVLGGLAAVAVLAVTVNFRWRLLMHSAVLVVGLVAVAGATGEVYTAAATTGKASDALSSATTAILAVSLFAGLAGAGLGHLQARVRLEADGRARARTGGFVLTGVAVAAVLALGAVKADAIGDAVSDQWRSLKNPGVAFSGRVANDAAGRLSSIDPLERYDYWRVSAHGFLDAPLWGTGSGAFEHDYTQERRYPKVTRYPHNLALKVLGETGLIGLAAILAFLAAVVTGLLRVRHNRSPTERVVAAGALTLLAYFVAHGSFDWLEAYPVLAGPALAFPLVALVAVGPRATEPDAVPRPLAAGAAVAAGLAALSLLLPWFALRYRERAAGEWRTNAEVAYRNLDRAAALELFGGEAERVKGAIALSRGDLAGARVAFTRSLESESDWLPHFGLGLVAAATDDAAGARREFDAAKRLNPRDPNVPEVSRRALADGEETPAELLRAVLTSPFFTVERLG